MRWTRRWVGCALFGAGLLAAVSASASAAAPTITSVTFTGSQAHPVITIVGSAFGSRPSPDPTYHPPSPTHPLCDVKPVGKLSRYGYDYGTHLFLQDSATTPAWSAGRYRPGLRELDCIGLIIKTYTPTKIVYQLGAGYPHIPNTTPTYALAPGDAYVVGVDGTQYTGTVQYS
jgi:hypothetical protein